jgi:signal recognition particle receptor subunit beta
MTTGPKEAAGSEDDLGARVLSLAAHAERILSAHPRTQGLVADLPHPDSSPLRIALLGPYSAGKSMLIAALRRLPSEEVERLVDAAPKTHELAEYPWTDVTLVDLPGTLSGNDEDSRIARLGVRRADALMIVTTSELPGEAESQAILEALDADGFADRSVVVVNKMNAENSDPEVILGEIRARLGSFAARVPILPTDAKDYVDALNDPDLTNDQRELLTAESGVDALADELRRILAAGVDDVRPSAQAFELARVLADAEHQWDLAGEDLRAAEAATKVEDAVSCATEGVLRTLERESDAVYSVISAAGLAIANSVSDKDGRPLAATLRDADQRLDKARATFGLKFNSSLVSACDALTEEYGTRVARPKEWIDDINPLNSPIDGPPDGDSPLARVAIDVVNDGGKALGEWLAKVVADPNKGGLAEKVANRLIESPVGQKLLGIGGDVANGVGRFKPYGRIKAAQKVVKAAEKAQWAFVVLGPAIDLGGVLNDQMKRVRIDKYRQQIRDQFDRNATATKAALAESAGQWVIGWVLEVEQALDNLTNRGTEVIAQREAALDEIRSLRDDADGLVRVARGS